MGEAAPKGRVEGEAVAGAGDEGEAGQGGGVEKGEQSEAHLLG